MSKGRNRMIPSSWNFNRTMHLGKAAIISHVSRHSLGAQAFSTMQTMLSSHAMLLQNQYKHLSLSVPCFRSGLN
jgi:ureidoglycolate hydrolase